MITNKEILRQLSTDLKSGFFPPDSVPSDFIFFDIETTGLSPRSSRVFLIGLLHQDRNSSSAEMVQFLSQRSDDTEESAILLAFSNYIKSGKYLVHFNGTSFDIPYLTHRYEALGLEHPFHEIQQIDLYRELMHLPAFFRQMANHRQKTFENLVSYPRKDLLSGKEMIKIYQNYEKAENFQALHLLLLHNHDDLDGMTAILSLGRLRYLLSGDFDIQDITELNEKNLEGDFERKLLFTLTAAFPVPAQLSVSSSICYITVLNSTVKIKMPLYEGTLKYFYPDYKNYYYLPYEDEAVHKSVALYLDASRREKAKASNCYKKFSGNFICAPKTSPVPVLKEAYSSRDAYALWPFQDSSPALLKSYLCEILKTAVTEK